MILFLYCGKDFENSQPISNLFLLIYEKICLLGIYREKYFK